MFLSDLHVHSTFSDGKLTIAELVDLYGGFGFGAIAITDHLCETNTFTGRAAKLLGRTLTPQTFPRYMETLGIEGERAWRQYGMRVIPGFELTKNSISNRRSAHILGLGISEFVVADADVIELARKIRVQGGIAVAAHPVHTRVREKQTFHLWDRRKELEREFDAWEVASGPHVFDEVARSGLPLLATSDFHRPAQLRAWKTAFECDRESEAILDSIRKQDLEFRFFEPAKFAKENGKSPFFKPTDPGLQYVEARC